MFAYLYSATNNFSHLSVRFYSHFEMGFFSHFVMGFFSNFEIGFFSHFQMGFFSHLEMGFFSPILSYDEWDLFLAYRYAIRRHMFRFSAEHRKSAVFQNKKCGCRIITENKHRATVQRDGRGCSQQWRT